MNKQKPKLVAFRVSEEEYEQIEKRIAESGKKKQDFFWDCIMEQPIIKREYDPLKMNQMIDEMEKLNRYIKAYGNEFYKQGINLNQIAKKMNEQGGSVDVREISEKLEKAYKESEEIWQSLKRFLQMLQSDAL